MKPRVMPTTYFLVLLASSIVLRLLIPGSGNMPEPYNYSGVVFILVGIALNLWADRIFKVRGTTVKPHERPSTLITTGPFGISRHPMYLGMALILLGTMLFIDPFISILSAAIFVAAMETSFIPMERRNLEKEFGNTYSEYGKKTRRWI